METITTAYTGAGWNEVYEGDDLEGKTEMLTPRSATPTAPPSPTKP